MGKNIQIELKKKIKEEIYSPSLIIQIKQNKFILKNIAYHIRIKTQSFYYLYFHDNKRLQIISKYYYLTK